VVAFYLPGGVPVYMFSLLMGVGAALGMAWVTWHTSEKERLLLINASLWSLSAALAGGRAIYMVVNWQYYRQFPLEIFQVYLGGLAWWGALAGGLVMVAIYAWRLQKSLGELLDGLFPLLTSLAVFSGLACWLDGCAYGPLAIDGWGLLAVDDMGHMTLRLPIQLIGAAAAAFWFVVIDTQRARLFRPKVAGWLGLLGVAAIQLGLTVLRADPGIFVSGLRLDAWAALGFSVIALIGALVTWRS